ncbi:MAG: hypothetical protein J5850_02890 [Clostridia bacterium]|nr:hypothetical protein [Clostridia bacterium]
MKFTRILAFLLAAVMLVSLISCGKDDKPATTTAAQGDTTTGNAGPDDKTPTTPETPVTGGDLTAFLAKAFPVSGKINNLRNKGYEVAEGSDAANLFDDDLATTFAATVAEGNTLTWKLSLPTTLVGYVMYAGTAPKAWTLQGSTDGSSWTDLDVVGESNMAATAGAGFGYEIDAAAQAVYSYYKLVFTDIPADGKIELAEIALIGTNEETPCTNEEDLASYLIDGSDMGFMVGEVTADGITVDDPKALFDGNAETVFAGKAAAGASVTLKYAAPTGINSYIITAGAKVPESWSIYVSEDGTNWKLVDVACKGNLVASARNGYDMDRIGVQANYLKIVFNKEGDVEIADIMLIGFSELGPTVDGGVWSTHTDEAGRTVYRLEKARAYNHNSFNLYKLGYVNEGQSFRITLGSTYSVPWPNGSQGSFGIYACGQDLGGDGAIDENGDLYYLCYSTGLIEKNDKAWGGWNVSSKECYTPESPDSYVVFTLEYDGAGKFSYYYDGVLTAEIYDEVSDPFTEGYVCICCKQSTEDGPLDYTLYEFVIND